MLVDLLHKSDAWQERDYKREDCIVCSSCGEDEWLEKCKKRSIIKETYCTTCEERRGKENLNLKEINAREKYIFRGRVQTILLILSESEWTKFENGN